MMSLGRDMSTAPKDGTEIICYVDRHWLPDLYELHWSETKQAWVDRTNFVLKPTAWWPYFSGALS